LDTRNRLIKDGIKPGSILTSGTPSFPIALKYKGFEGLDHRVGPGTTVFWDNASEEFGEKGFKFAATVLTRVLSRPTNHNFTCDAGSKAIAAEVSWPVATVLNKHKIFEGRVPSEEHFPFTAFEGNAPKAGSLVELVPKHVCPTVNLAEKALFLEGNTPLAIVDVGARAHATGPFTHKPFNMKKHL
jgi:D-serine deaminase-like pyridoxal phosphate-dependent protein